MRTKLMIAVLAVLVLPIQTVWAAQNGNPKPLTADTPSPSTTAQPPKDPNELPQEYVDLRKKVKDEFNAWMANDEQVQKDCQAARTNVDRLACDQKKRLSQKRLDGVHAMTRDMQRKIDTWRRKQAGLPPPEWWPPEGQPTNPPANSSGGNQPKESPVLLPQDSKPLPAGTF